MNCTCSLEKFFKGGCDPGSLFLFFVLLALNLNYAWLFRTEITEASGFRRWAAATSALISLSLQCPGLPFFLRLTNIFGPQMAFYLVFQYHDAVLQKCLSLASSRSQGRRGGEHVCFAVRKRCTVIPARTRIHQEGRWARPGGPSPPGSTVSTLAESTSDR